MRLILIFAFIFASATATFCGVYIKTEDFTAALLSSMMILQSNGITGYFIIRIAEIQIVNIQQERKTKEKSRLWN
jgi:hypothetical protein